MTIVLSRKDMQSILDYPTSTDVEWPNKVHIPAPGQAPLSLAMTYSKMKDFNTCPRLYYMKHLTHKYPYQDTPATLWGTKVHAAHEDYLFKGKDMPQEVKKRIGTGVADMLIDKEQRLSDAGNLAVPLFGEQEWAIDITGRQANWRSARGVFMRGKADVGLASKKVLYVFDFKTGKASHPDLEQLDVMALLAVAQPSLIQYTDVRTNLLFLEAKKIVPETGPHRVDMTQGIGHLRQLQKWQKMALTIIDHYQRDYFPEKRSGLCGWCPDIKCPFNTSQK